MSLFSFAGWLAWIITVIVMLAKPLSILFKGVFVKILPYRQWLGITLSLIAIGHVTIFAVERGQSFDMFINPNFWNFQSLIGWGLLAFVVMIPLFITSNKFSMKLLKRNWKRIQQLAYLFFLVLGTHIYMANGQWYFSLLPIGIWLALYLVALMKLSFSKKK